MQTAAPRFRTCLLTLILGAVLAITCLADTTNPPVQNGGERMREKVKDAVADGRTAVREGVEKADTALTNAVHQIGVGVHKGMDVATNVAAKVKVAVTNTVSNVTQAVRNATH